jgi:Vacuolar sorting protein 9 (VPS9) domain
MEVSDFWKGYDIPAKKLSIDTDQLQGILIYVVSRMKYPQILTEVHIVEKFLPKGVRKSARAMYLEMIGAACSYLLDLNITKYTMA